jgi:hypothetical protein
VTTYLNLAIGLLLGAIAAPAAALAGEARLRLLAEGIDLPAPRSAQLDAIGLRDLAVGGRDPAGVVTGQVHGAAGGMTAALTRVPVAAIDLRVRRQLPVRWQVDLPADRRHAPPRIRVEAQTHDGQVGALGLADGSAAVLPVRIDAGSSRVAARDDRRELLEGDIWLEFDLGAAPGAGRYEGRITVGLEYL